MTDRILVNNFNRLVSWMLLAEFGSGLINFSGSFLNTFVGECFRIFASRLFQSVIIAWKKGPLKQIMSDLKLGILLL